MNSSKLNADRPQTISHQKDSGLSIADYCSIHKVSPSSLKLNKLNAAEGGGFVKANIVVQPSKPANQMIDPPEVITLSTAAGQLSLPKSISPRFIVDLIRGLS